MTNPTLSVKGFVAFVEFELSLYLAAGCGKMEEVTYIFSCINLYFCLWFCLCFLKTTPHSRAQPFFTRFCHAEICHQRDIESRWCH